MTKKIFKGMSKKYIINIKLLKKTRATRNTLIDSYCKFEA